MTEKEYWVAFSNAYGIGPKKFAALLDRFGSAKVAWGAAPDELHEILKDSLTIKFEKFRKEFRIDRYLERMDKLGVSFITLAEDTYPYRLKQIPNPPFILYVKGSLSVISSVARDPQEISLPRQARDRNDNCIAIVGARKITTYGREVTELFTADLVTAGFTIVSGLAMGVDAVAHQTTVDNGGKTIAVLGCGVDCCTPRENQRLYDAIIATGGTIISEFPLGMLPSIGSFPSRNRIVAGLSQGVLVTEGAEDSGSLITAEYALDFGRKVFAVPGPITSGMSKGPYKLISKGAKLVTSAQEILSEFQMTNVSAGRQGDKLQVKFKDQNPNYKNATKDEKKILDLLANEALTFDELIKKGKFDVSQLGSLLSLMEIKGMIKGTGDQYALI